MSDLSNIEFLLSSFIKEHEVGLTKLYKTYNPYSSYSLFIDELIIELRTNCILFLAKNDSLSELDSYLFYLANDFAKRNSKILKKVTEYLCPGCLFLGKKNIINSSGLFFKCSECKSLLESSTDLKKRALFKIFKFHNKRGYKCPECNRFIPHPIYDTYSNITCPYLDCCFVGDVSILKRMHHPNVQTNFKQLNTINVLSESLIEDQKSKLDIKQDLNNKVKIINDVISNQTGNLSYNSTSYTLTHKVSVYKAIKNLLYKFPEEMVNYLLYQSRSGGFQNKIFQEYIRLLEESFPICYKKGNKVLRIDSLLDPNLNIFDGISIFEAIISDKLDIKNNTQEFYIGGRKASYSQPYYIGKLLNIVNKESKQPLMHLVQDYGFSKIRMKDISPGVEVIVTHLRVPPHYQMGGMVYINRIRKDIVDESLLVLNKNE